MNRVQRVFSIILCAFVSCSLFGYSGGSGTPEDPYQIAGAEDLIALGATPEDYDKHFILTQDIDLSEYMFDCALIASHPIGGSQWSFQGEAFTGVFDGVGHTIRNLKIDGEHYVGLFGYIADRSVIRNLQLVNVQITSVGNYVGGVIGGSGWSSSDSRVTNCHASGSVTGTDYVGGLMGQSYGGITDCHSSGSVVGNSHVGGLLGSNTYGNVSRSSSEASVIGKDYVGGLVGRSYYGSNVIASFFGPATVTGERYVGGLVGETSYGSNITSCYSDGTVNGQEAVGGLVGESRDSNIGSSYSTASVLGETKVGGLVGNSYIDSAITACYSTGSVSGTVDVGGLVGYTFGRTVLNSFWDIERSGQSESSGGTGLRGTGLHSMQAQPIATYLDAGWDFQNESTNGLCQWWVMPDGGGCPILSVFNGVAPPELVGEGTSSHPYQIRTASDLGAIPHYDLLAHFQLTADIDLSGILWSSAPIPWFRGTFDGNGFVVSNLTMSGQGYLAFCAILSGGGKITQMGMLNVNIDSDDNAGAFVGHNRGNVISCYSTGTIDGDWGVGGLVGWNIQTIVSCYSTAAVSGRYNVGGLVGYNSSGSITKSFSTGTVSNEIADDDSVGGLVGRWGGSNVGGVAHCFWDVEKSGQGGSAGGAGLSSEEATSAEWVALNGFADDPNWVLDSGLDHPRLAWQNTPGQLIPAPVIDWLAGNGTTDDPYQIETANQLTRTSKASLLWDRNFILTSDVDMTGRVFLQPVIPYFSGHFNGNGHAIQNLGIHGKVFTGLVGYQSGGSTICNLGLQDVEIYGFDKVGALIGSNRGVVRNCYSTGTVNGYYWTGGLVGLNGSSYGTGIEVSHSYSTCTVNGGGSAGGLVGRNESTIVDCYSRGVVHGNMREYSSYRTNQLGGLVGNNYRGTVTNSFSTGPVDGDESTGGLIGADYSGTVTGSFWDTDSSGCTQSAGGVAATTAQMQDIHIYLDAGWDFLDETVNGSDDAWKMPKAKGYPLLAWQVDLEPVITIEDFESGDFSTFSWLDLGTNPWTIASQERHSGEYCARAAPVGSGQSTSLSVVLECRDGEISFWQKVSCHSTMAGLEFYIDDERVASWSGRREWEQASFPVTGGTHTFTWTYSKTGWSSLGEDTAWIDDVTLPLGAPAAPSELIDVVGDKDGFGLGLLVGEEKKGFFDNRQATDPGFTDVLPAENPVSYSHTFSIPPNVSVDSAKLRWLTLGIQDGDSQVQGSDIDLRLFVDDVEVPGAFDTVDQFHYNGSEWVAFVGLVEVPLTGAALRTVDDGHIEVRIDFYQLGTSASQDAIALDYSELELGFNAI